MVGRARTGGPAAGRGVRFAFRSLSVILVCIVYVRATTMLVDTEAYTEQRTLTQDIHTVKWTSRTRIYLNFCTSARDNSDGLILSRLQLLPDPK